MMEISEKTAGICRYALKKLLKNNRKQEAYWEKQAENSQNEFKKRALELAKKNSAETLAALKELGGEEE